MKRVLITEDDGLIAEIYRDTFEREGFSAEVAPDGAVAIQRLRGNPPDVVLLDLMMPNVSGVEVLKFIRSEPALQSLPVIVMSNAFASAMGREASVAGATKMFAKNACGPKKLVAEVKELLAANAPASNSAGVEDTTIRVKDFRRDVMGGLPQRMMELGRLVEGFASGAAATRERLREIHQAVHQLAGMVSLAGFGALAQLACALEALLQELNAKPEKVNISSVRTIVDAVATLGLLGAKGASQQEEAVSAPLILVVDDDAISRETTCAALEQAHLRALSVDSPKLALRLAQDNRFDLLLSDVQMPEMNGLELSQHFHATATNAKTPVIFVTSLKEYEARIRSIAGNDGDFIAKPILLTELAVKALRRLVLSKSRPPGH